MIILFTIVLSGSIIPFIFFEGYNYLLILFLIVLLFVVFVKSKIIKVSLFSFLFLISVTLFLLLHLIMKNSFTYMNSYFGLLARFTIAFLITQIFTFRSFIEKYIVIISIIVFISLLFYFGGILRPDLISSLPVSYNDAGTGYRHLYIYFFQGISSWNRRNSGIFWEGGAFQLYINVALLFRLFYLRRFSKRDVFINLLLLSGIITTFSTIGILFLLFQLLLIFNREKLIVKFTIYFLLFLMIFSTDFVYTLIISKFLSSSSSGSERLIGMISDLVMFFNFPILGAGFEYINTHFDRIAYSLGSQVPSSTNSITGSLAMYGLFFTMYILTPLLRLPKYISSKLVEQITAFIIILLLLSSQGVLYQLLFICLMFYVVQGKFTRQVYNLEDIYENSHNSQCVQDR